MVVVAKVPMSFIRAFGINSSSPKFLVYNDGFNSNWKAFVNGLEVKVYRANVAFKGVYLPEGVNEVLFLYSPLGGEMIYWFILLFYLLFFIYSLSLVSIHHHRRRRMVKK